MITNAAIDFKHDGRDYRLKLDNYTDANFLRMGGLAVTRSNTMQEVTAVEWDADVSLQQCVSKIVEGVRAIK